jgi:hypothetical protein
VSSAMLASLSKVLLRFWRLRAIAGFPDWPCTHYKRGGGDALVLYTVFGKAPEEFVLTKDYSTNGIPEGVEMYVQTKSQAPSSFGLAYEGYIGAELGRKQLLAKTIGAQNDCADIQRGNPQKDDEVWLLPCLFVHNQKRGAGLSEKLVRSAVGLAEEHRATAIEAFPYSGTKRRSKETQVGGTSDAGLVFRLVCAGLACRAWARFGVRLDRLQPTSRRGSKPSRLHAHHRQRRARGSPCRL